MAIPRFTLLQLLGAMTVCGVLFCIAAIDPVGSLAALLIFFACIVMALIMGALTYLVTRILSELVYLLVGRPSAPSPFAAVAAIPERPATATPDLATAVDMLRSDADIPPDSPRSDRPPSSGSES